jgi:hypothetical protein
MRSPCLLVQSHCCRSTERKVENVLTSWAIKVFSQRAGLLRAQMLLKSGLSLIVTRRTTIWTISLQSPASVLSLGGSDKQLGICSSCFWDFFRYLFVLCHKTGSQKTTVTILWGRWISCHWHDFASTPFSVSTSVMPRFWSSSNGYCSTRWKAWYKWINE